MGRMIFTTIILFFVYLTSFAQTTYTISIEGFTFSPDDIAIAPGDTIFFDGSSTHPVLQVSEDTWNAGGDTPLSGGFSFPSGVGHVGFDNVGTYYYICENHVSSGMKGTINVAEATSIKDFSTQKLLVYPNPLNDDDYLTIVLPHENNQSRSEVNIYDLTGRNKINQELPGGEKQTRIDCSSLFPGAYILQIKKENTILTSKFIKK